LLVDDDDNGPDVSGTYTQTLESLGIAYAYWDTQPMGQEPDADFLTNFRSVVWFTGDNYMLWTGPTGDGEASLSAWLDGGGCLLFSSQDYFYVQGVSNFMESYLGVTAVVEEVNHTTVTGDGQVFGDLGPYILSFPFKNFSDGLTPLAGAEVALNGNASVAAVNWDSGTFKTTYWGFPFETLPTLAARKAAMMDFVAWCKPYVLHLPLISR
jgi:hypothetical protein